MNWKQIVYKGLPVLLIAAVIVIVAAVASRPEPQPEVTKEDDKVIDFENLIVTRGELYDMMKQSIGISSLIDLIDRDLLADYADEVDTEALQDRIEAEKKNQTADKFYQNMVMQGVIETVDDPNRDEKIENFYLLNYLQRAYAREQAITEISDTKIQEEKDSYRPDLCLITLEFESKNDADDFADELEQASDKRALFESEYDEQNEDDSDTDDDEEVDVPDFYETEFVCDFDLAVYENYSDTSKFRDFVFNEAFEIGTYNEDPYFILDDSTYYFVYKLSTPQLIDDYKESTEFNDYIVDKLIGNKLTSTYIKNKVTEFRTKAKLKIYDTEVGELYISGLDEDFEVEEKLLKSDENVVASYKIGDETKYVYADDLYNHMKLRYGIQLLLDKINYEALTHIKEIQLSKSEKNDITAQIKTLKTNYLAQQQTLTWREYIALYFGAFSEEELADILAGPKLTDRYILGYKDYEGVEPITDEEIQAAYEEWFSISAYHILFEFDPEDQESKDLAEQKALQVINGCSQEEIDNDECYILYDKEDKTTDTEETFEGLYAADSKQYKTIFAALAKAYSDDPSAAQNSGNLGAFGPDAMVDEFEAAAKVIVQQIEDGDVPFSILPVETEIEQPDGSFVHGYHVIYVTGTTDKEPKPELYDQYLTDKEDDDVDLNEKYTTAQLTAFNKYKTFIDKIEADLESERTTADYQNKVLAELRDQYNFSFKDSEMQAIYDNINEMHKNLDSEEDQ